MPHSDGLGSDAHPRLRRCALSGRGPAPRERGGYSARYLPCHEFPAGTQLALCLDKSAAVPTSCRHCRRPTTNSAGGICFPIRDDCSKVRRYRRRLVTTLPPPAVDRTRSSGNPLRSISPLTGSRYPASHRQSCVLRGSEQSRPPPSVAVGRSQENGSAGRGLPNRRVRPIPPQADRPRIVRVRGETTTAICSSAANHRGRASSAAEESCLRNCERPPPSLTMREPGRGPKAILSISRRNDEERDRIPA